MEPGDAEGGVDRRVDRLAGGRLRWSILRPRIVLAGATLALAGGVCAAWRFTVRPRTGHVDLSIIPEAEKLGLAG